jgi:two-component system cell cycle response regulator DivK
MERRILIVDDHEPGVALIERLLELDGHKVRAAGALAEEQPAMIVLDLNLPDGSGLELTRKLKAHPVTAEIPILACTAAVLPADEHEALEAGCDAYVSKPIDLHRFQTIVASMLAA